MLETLVYSLQSVQLVFTVCFSVSYLTLSFVYTFLCMWIVGAPAPAAASACSMPVWECRQNPDPGFRLYLAGLLQLAVLWHSRWFDEPPAVTSECRCTSHHQSQAMQAHHANPTSAALAASLQTTGFQDIHPRLSFVGWYRSFVPSWRMYAVYCHWLPFFCGLLTLEHTWSRDHATSSVNRCFATAGPTLWNSLPEQLRQPDVSFGQFKRSLKTFMFS